MKPSWTDIAAFGLLLFFALVMANGWPIGEWALGWSAVGAIATIVTGGIAARIAYVQYQDSRLAKEEHRKSVQESFARSVNELESRLSNLSSEVLNVAENMSIVNSSWLHVLGEHIRQFPVDALSLSNLELTAEDMGALPDSVHERLNTLREGLDNLVSAHSEFLRIVVNSPTLTQLFYALRNVVEQTHEVLRVTNTLELEGRVGNRGFEISRQALISLNRFANANPAFASARQLFP
nr:hypothetical protein 12 [Pseudomonadaceae bacterium]